ncbi:Armadillo repeat-containing protein 7 [Apophysomyces sp. BC1034]|nr:Armadillo repeat-containing protein 7 [Apophysomyces sp. BC1021]KAG0184996.1 Armadillo repeat-containing protein 7 [Apophysomyces sp. BC1034]
MFQTNAHIARRRGTNGTDRGEYLRQLVQEYEATKDLDSRQQILANLANFAYDPINYDWLWQLNVVELFLNAITENDPLLKEFGMGGLANVCLESRHHSHIVSEPYYIRAIMACILEDSPSCTDNTIVNAMTTLMFLITPESQSSMLNSRLKSCV